MEEIERTLLIDKVVSEALALMNKPEKIAFLKFDDIFEPRGERLVSHIKDKWHSYQGDFASFYLNSDEKGQRLLLESFGIKVGPSKYPETEEGVHQKAMDYFSKSRWDIEPFEIQMVFQFYLMCNNNSLQLVENLEGATVLNRHLEKSEVDKYGNGRNWSEYYTYLGDRGIAERSQIVEYAFTEKH